MWFCDRLDKEIKYFNQTLGVKLSITHFKRLNYVHYILQVPQIPYEYIYIYINIEYLFIYFCNTYFLTRIKL